MNPNSCIDYFFFLAILMQSTEILFGSRKDVNIFDDINSWSSSSYDTFIKQRLLLNNDAMQWIYFKVKKKIVEWSFSFLLTIFIHLNME